MNGKTVSNEEQRSARDTWETYTAAWKSNTEEAKRALFAQSLDAECEYADPHTIARGWDSLIRYMRDLHNQMPGAHFVTTYFLAHHKKSIARWHMVDGGGRKLNEGISYGAYNNQGKLVSMTGFFETPPQ